MFRSLVLLTLAGGVALGAWSSLPATQLIPWGSENVAVGSDEPQPPHDLQHAAFTAEAPEEPSYVISYETIEAIRCGPWDVSAAGMEAILDEMIRRGWTPPDRATALARNQPQFGLQALALDPEAPATATKFTAPQQPDPLVKALEPDQPALAVGPSQQPGIVERPGYTN